MFLKYGQTNQPEPEASSPYCASLLGRMYLPTPQLGPALRASICTPSLEQSIKAWQGSLHHQPHSTGHIDATRADSLGAPSLAGAPFTLMANELGEPWLELIESPTAAVLDPFTHSGWF
jgi:hypothetical protein